MNLIFRFILKTIEIISTAAFMRNFNLEILFEISGIGSASGLIYINNEVYIISDNSTFLYHFNFNERKLNRINLSENSQENIAKIIKPDFEAIVLKGKKLYIFGSGSTINREKCIIYNLNTKNREEKNLNPLYEKLRLKIGISADELNIEGAFYNSGKWYFFQRGNGASSKNGVFIYNRKAVDFKAIQLPKIQNIEATFTDAILIEDKIYFLAAVENTMSTYDDGEILGCFIGCLSLETLEIIFTYKISDSNKFEGLTLFDNSNSNIDFLLCEDNDTDCLKTKIYKLTISKK